MNTSETPFGWGTPHQLTVFSKFADLKSSIETVCTFVNVVTLPELELTQA